MAKFNKGIVISASGIFAFSLAMSMFGQSCRSSKSLAEPMVVNTIRVHDTIRVIVPKQMPKKIMTADELQNFLQPYYKKNFDLFFAPTFDELRKENERLSSDVHTLTINNAKTLNMLMRSRKKRDSLERVSGYYQQQSLYFQKENLKNRIENTEQVKIFMRTTSSALRLILIVGASVIIVVLMLGIAVYLLWRKVHYLRNSLQYAK